MTLKYNTQLTFVDELKCSVESPVRSCVIMCNKHHLHDMVNGEYGGDGLIPTETILKLFEPHNVNGEDIYIVL